MHSKHTCYHHTAVLLVNAVNHANSWHKAQRCCWHMQVLTSTVRALNSLMLHLLMPIVL